MVVNQDLTRNHHRKIGIPGEAVCGFGVAM